MIAKPEGCRGCPFETTGIGFVPPEGSAEARVQVCGEAPGEEEADTGRPFSGKSGKIMRRAMQGGGLGQECSGCGGAGRQGGVECRMCVGVGVTFPDVVIYNTIQCRPPGNDYRAVPSEAVEWCRRVHWPKMGGISPFRSQEVHPHEPQHDTCDQFLPTQPQPDGSIGVTYLVGAQALAAHVPGLTSIERWSGSVIPREAGGLGPVSPRLPSRWVYLPMVHPAFVMRGNWAMLPILAAIIRAGIRWLDPLYTIPIPYICDRVDPPIQGERVLCIDCEYVKGQRGRPLLVGWSWDGVAVEQVAPDWITQGLGRVQAAVDAAQIILIHNARADVVDQLEPAGISVDRAKVVDTLIAQAVYQSDLGVGLDDALGITLPGEWLFHKALSGETLERRRLRAQTMAVWSRVLGGRQGGMDKDTLDKWDDVNRERFYNALDVGSTWRLGMRLMHRLAA